jgi:hypothetical protein
VEKEEKVKWYLRPLGVFLLLFFVLGPFGLPFLYKSPKFSRRLKMVLTVVVIFYTTYLIIGTVQIARKLYIELEEYQGMLRGRPSKKGWNEPLSYLSMPICKGNSIRALVAKR